MTPDPRSRTALEFRPAGAMVISGDRNGVGVEGYEPVVGEGSADEGRDMPRNSGLSRCSTDA